MTIEEKIKMYKGKKAFIDNISKAFEVKPTGSTVESIEYEVYRKGTVEPFFFVEFLVVNFFGGGKSVMVCSGNSNTANFRMLGKMIDGGYYDEIRAYESLEDNGYVKVDFDNQSELDKHLAKPMNHISDVRRCFSYCKNIDDVDRVIDKIPNGFGTFTVYHKEDADTFLVVNNYEENGEIYEDRDEYDFWEEG